ncbi:hypothetical protein ONS95_010463 [Cadophora gregata]|uniref:uncharacterized protein n=1 Tax=Cadophora gregata TaxID=51156 RepID=UPI0026DB3006|nr:uncharacterized protein ONS95_010463 [Cadophora gregata]KAK0122207.1 hypothetical protein ONS95_010463 [Cadophora gregata]
MEARCRTPSTTSFTQCQVRYSGWTAKPPCILNILGISSKDVECASSYVHSFKLQPRIASSILSQLGSCDNFDYLLQGESTPFGLNRYTNKLLQSVSSHRIALAKAH